MSMSFTTLTFLVISRGTSQDECDYIKSYISLYANIIFTLLINELSHLNDQPIKIDTEMD